MKTVKNWTPQKELRLAAGERVNRGRAQGMSTRMHKEKQEIRANYYESGVYQELHFVKYNLF